MSKITFKHLVRGSDLGYIAVLYFSDKGEDTLWTVEGIDSLAKQYADDSDTLHQLQIARRHLMGSFNAPVFEMQSDLFDKN